MKIENKNSIVAFIDILGFKNIIELNNNNNDNLIINQLQKALDQAYKKTIYLMSKIFSKIDKIDNSNLENRLKVRQFSDNIFFSVDFENDEEYELSVYFIALISASYQREMLSNNFYVRGGIAEGQNYFGENMIFSKALVQAYEIENKQAIYPRIVIQKSIIAKLESIPDDNIINTLHPKLVVKDWIGLSFLNPFNLMSATIEMLDNFPEIIDELEEVLDDSLLAEFEKLEPDIQDHEFVNIVLKDINQKMIDYYNTEPELYVKYVWLNEFIKWNSKNECKLKFEYITL